MTEKRVVSKKKRKPKTDYKILTNGTKEFLEIAVLDCLNEGYKLVGGAMQTAPTGGQWVQTVVRYADDD